MIGDPVDLAVSWQVRNQGTSAGLVDRWIDRVVLSRNDTPGDGDDLVIGEFPHVGLLPVGVVYERSETILLPPATEGRFHLFVTTDATDVVYEHTNLAANVGRCRILWM